MQFAISRWRQHSLSCTWEAWVAQAKHSKISLRSNFDLMSQKLQNSRLSTTWMAWISRLKHRRALQSILLTAMDSIHDVKLKAYFDAWKQRHLVDASLKNKLRQSSHAVLVTKLRSTFWAWTLQAKNNLYLREKLRKMLYRLLEARLAMAFTSWREAATNLRQCRNLVFSAVTRLKYQVRPTLQFVLQRCIGMLGDYTVCLSTMTIITQTSPHIFAFYWNKMHTKIIIIIIIIPKCV